MRIHVVSDVHGRSDALRRAGDGADALICLGDLLLFMDYADHSKGIFADLFGQEATTRYIGLRTAQQFDAAREFSARMWASIDGNPADVINQAVQAQYSELFEAMPAPAFLTYGNVDIPRMWGEYLRAGHQVLDGESGRDRRADASASSAAACAPCTGRLMSSTMRYSPRRLRRLARLTCSAAHIPPDIPELLFDTVAERMERGSAALLDAVRRTQPRYLLFGHVHQPLVASVQIGRTQCVNVGHFSASGTPFVLQW